MDKEKQIKKIWLQYEFDTFCFKSSVDFNNDCQYSFLSKFRGNYTM